jgi:hypothetical protein
MPALELQERVLWREGRGTMPGRPEDWFTLTFPSQTPGIIETALHFDLHASSSISVIPIQLLVNLIIMKGNGNSQSQTF